MATEVGERIEAEAQARLERAAEVGRLQREAEQIHRSIIELSTDIRAALAARDTGQSQASAMRSDAEARQTYEQIRAVARERWLEYREHAAQMDKYAGKDNGAELTADRQQGHELPDDDFAL